MRSVPSVTRRRQAIHHAVRWGVLCALLSLVCAPTFTRAQDVEKKAEPEQLLNPKEFPKGWVHFTPEANSPLEAVWQVQPTADAKDCVLICLGKPDGYLRTEKEYENFELGLEWKYPSDPDGNSGIMLHTIEKDMIWPKSVLLQLHRPSVGSVFASSGAKLDNPLTAKDLSLPVNEWNSCVIISQGGRIEVTINGKRVGEVTGCMPNKGTIGFQSEGSEIHFRKIWIRPLPPKESRLTQRKVSQLSSLPAPWHPLDSACDQDKYLQRLFRIAHNEPELIGLSSRQEVNKLQRAWKHYENTGRDRHGLIATHWTLLQEASDPREILVPKPIDVTPLHAVEPK